jgi:hypothetical protein
VEHHPRDWETTSTVNQILSRVLTSPYLQTSAIILLQARGLHTGDALDALVTVLQYHMGFAPATLPQLPQQ